MELASVNTENCLFVNDQKIIENEQANNRERKKEYVTWELSNKQINI